LSVSPKEPSKESFAGARTMDSRARCGDRLTPR